MQFRDLDLGSVTEIELEKRGDDRGFFARLYCSNEFKAKGLTDRWVQINNSLTTTKGTVRGLHFQRQPSAEVKLVRCIKGAIYDVAVDLRQGSETYGLWRGVELTAENRTMLYIPEGFAHGFQALEDECEIIYFNSANYAPDQEGGLRCDDPAVGIEWPLPIVGLSERDKELPDLSNLTPIQLQMD